MHVCLYCAHQQYRPGNCDQCGKEDGICERFRSISVRDRQHPDLLACVRPISCFEGVPSPNKDAGRFNPGSLILSAVMMLHHMRRNEAADLIPRGMQRAIRKAHVTCDLARMMKSEGRQDVTELSCSGFAEAIVDRM